jgi:hypothetical protein
MRDNSASEEWSDELNVCDGKGQTVLRYSSVYACRLTAGYGGTWRANSKWVTFRIETLILLQVQTREVENGGVFRPACMRSQSRDTSCQSTRKMSRDG